MKGYTHRVGETITTKEGYLATIVAYTVSTDIEVIFNDEQNTKIKTRYEQFQKQNICNPNHRSVYGVGYMGVGKYGSTNLDGKKTKRYETWCNMMKRCYSERYQQKRPTYVGCTVCEEWHNFQNFAKWYEENYYEVDGEQMHLDKDILVKGNKVYSPESCVFVPKIINSLFTKRQRGRGELPIGITLGKGANKYIAYCNNSVLKKQVKLGRFPHIEEAFLRYKTYKENHIKEVANRYINKIPNNLYDAMMNYEVNIND